MTRYTVEVGKAPALSLSVSLEGDDSPAKRLIALSRARRQAAVMGFRGPAQVLRVEPVPGVEVVP